MWDLIVSVPNHCLSFYFVNLKLLEMFVSYRHISRLLIMCRTICFRPTICSIHYLAVNYDNKEPPPCKLCQ